MGRPHFGRGSFGFGSSVTLTLTGGFFSGVLPIEGESGGGGGLFFE
jgi:hypothetical protein